MCVCGWVGGGGDCVDECGWVNAWVSVRARFASGMWIYVWVGRCVLKSVE